MKPAVAALLVVSLAAVAQPAKQTRFDPTTDCDKTPLLIRDAAKDARINARRVCYVNRGIETTVAFATGHCSTGRRFGVSFSNTSWSHSS